MVAVKYYINAKVHYRSVIYSNIVHLSGSFVLILTGADTVCHEGSGLQCYVVFSRRILLSLIFVSLMEAIDASCEVIRHNIFSPEVLKKQKVKNQMLI